MLSLSPQVVPGLAGRGAPSSPRSRGLRVADDGAVGTITPAKQPRNVDTEERSSSSSSTLTHTAGFTFDTCQFFFHLAPPEQEVQAGVCLREKSQRGHPATGRYPRGLYRLLRVVGIECTTFGVEFRIALCSQLLQAEDTFDFRRHAY